MSRSKRKTPIIPVCQPNGMKFYRQNRSGSERMYERMLLQKALQGDEHSQESLSVEQNPWDEWACPRDGKQYLDDPKWSRLLRK